MRSLLPLLVCLWGCDEAFGLERSPSDAGNDAAIEDVPADALRCEMPGISEDYEATSDACGAWGAATMQQAAMVVTDGELRILPDGDTASDGGCISLSAISLPDSGMSIKVTSVFVTTNTFQFFRTVSPEPTGSLVAQFSVGGGMLSFISGPTVTAVPYDGQTMRYWRLRPDAGRTRMLGEVSPDRVRWQTIGTADGTVPTRTRFEFAGGTFDASADAPGQAGFDDVNVCL